MTEIIVSDIIELLGSKDLAAKAAFLDACPASPALAIAKKYITQPHLEINLAGLNSLAETYARGIDCRLGVALSEAVYRLSQEALLNHFQDDYLQNAFLFCAGSSLTSWLVGLNNSGQYLSTIQIGESGYEWLSQKTYPESKEHQAIVRLSMVDACLQLAYGGDSTGTKTLEQAGKLLEKTDWSGLSPVYQQTLAQLRRTYHKLVQSATQLPEDAHPNDTNSELFQELDQNLGVLNSGIEALQGAFPEIADRFKSIAQQLGDAHQQGDANSFSEWALKNQPLADALTDFLSAAKLEEKQKLQLQKQIRKASLIFTDPAHSHNPKTIQNSLSILQDARQQTRRHHFIEDENDALWGLYLCYSRLQQEDEAIDVLQALRQNLERLRSGIADPLKRAGVFQKYPYLFAALCQLLCRASRPAELLNAMEGAKGRALADVLTQKQGRAVEDSTFSEPVQYLPQLMQQVHSHYLSYLVDDDSTYAVLVTKQGELHSIEIPLGKTLLREWTSGLDPKTWGKPIKGLAGPRIPHDLPDKLSPLVSWLTPLVKAGQPKQQDHICYCPDEELHLVPLHYVTYMGQPLIKWFSISRIQGAFSLVSLLQQPVDYLSQSVVVQVPLKSEKENVSNPKTAAKLNQIQRGATWLMQHLPNQSLVEAQADLAALQKLDLRYKVIHFSTHGTFPEEDKNYSGRDNNPYTSSGLLLADSGNLPNTEHFNQANSPHLLNPEKALNLVLSGSHISIMACVSGLSKEGIGGDALGLEWAFLQAGASSLLSTHWNTDATAAAEFSLRFYNRWLVQRFPRSAAWRQTALELMDLDWSSRHPSAYFWAAFSLSGDWR